MDNTEHESYIMGDFKCSVSVNRHCQKLAICKHHNMDNTEHEGYIMGDFKCSVSVHRHCQTFAIFISTTPWLTPNMKLPCFKRWHAR